MMEVRVVFPEPFSPMMATTSPDWMLRLTSFRAGEAEEGYAKVRFLTTTAPSLGLGLAEEEGEEDLEVLFVLHLSINP